MPIKELSILNQINFDLIELKKWESFETEGNKIITIVLWEVKDKLNWTLNTFDSSVYHSWNIVAEEDTLLSVFDIKDIKVILNKIDVEKDFWDYCRNNWSQLRKLYDVEWFEEIDLYRWDQIEKEFWGEKYRLNLWFCWKEVDCLFHNQHDFIEIHTGIIWDWYMQKSIDWTDKTLIETVHLGVWQSHKPFNLEWQFEENWNPKYPMHRYLGWPTWNIWLVVEKY
jgi:hypothetical protein